MKILRDKKKTKMIRHIMTKIKCLIQSTDTRSICMRKRVKGQIVYIQAVLTQLSISLWTSLQRCFHLLFCLFPTFHAFYSHISFLVFVPSPVCVNSGARRLHRHDDMTQTISSFPSFSEENRVGGLTMKAPDPWRASTPMSNPTHVLTALRSTGA